MSENKEIRHYEGMALITTIIRSYRLDHALIIINNITTYARCNSSYIAYHCIKIKLKLFGINEENLFYITLLLIKT